MTSSDNSEKKNMSVQTVSGPQSNSAWIWVLCAVLGLGLVYTTVQMRKAQDRLAQVEKDVVVAKQDFAGAKAKSEAAASALVDAESKVTGLTQEVSGLASRLSDANDKAIAHSKVAAAKVQALETSIDGLKSKLSGALADRTAKGLALEKAREFMTRTRDGLANALATHKKAQTELQAAIGDSAKANADVRGVAPFAGDDDRTLEGR